MSPLVQRLLRLLATAIFFVGGMYLAIPSGFPHVWNRNVWLSILPIVGMILSIALIWRQPSATFLRAIVRATVIVFLLIIATLLLTQLAASM
jgi:hypothetical protein